MPGKEVRVSVIAETKRFQAAWRKLSRESGLTQLKTRMADLTKQAALAGAALATIGAGMGAGLAKLGANLEQSRGAVQDVFKESASTALEFSNKATRALGLTGNAYNELATILGSQLKNAGTPISDLAGKTNDLITLGADLSAMFGGTTQDAVNALSSALKGERDPIERYGVSLKQAAIDAKAAELGFTKVGNSFDQEAQTAATLALVMEQTRDAHGKFAREGDTLAHQMQVWKAVIVDLGERIGLKLTPYLTKISQLIFDRVNPAIERFSAWLDTDAVPAVEAFAARVKDQWLPVLHQITDWVSARVVPALQAFAQYVTGTVIPTVKSIAQFLFTHKDAVLAIAAAIGVIVTVWKTWTSALRAWRVIQLAVTTAQAAFNLILAANPIVLIITALAALAAGLYVLYQRSETVRNAVDAVWNGIKAVAAPVIEWFTTTLLPTLLGVWDDLKANALSLFQYFSNAWQTYGAPLFDLIVSVISGVASNFTLIWDGVKTQFSGVWTIISGILDAAFSTISSLLSIFVGLFTGDWSRLWDGVSSLIRSAAKLLGNIVKGLFTIIGGIFKTAFGVITGIVAGAWNGIKNLFTSAWSSLKNSTTNGINNVISFFRNLPSRILSALGNLGSLLWDAGSSLLSGFVDGIKSMWGSVKDSLTSLTSWLPNWKGPASLDRVLLTDNGQLVIDGFIRGLESRYGAVKDSLAGLTASVADTSFSAPTPSRAVHTTAAHGVTINLYSLTPTVETGRTIAQALSQYHALNGVRA